MLLLTMREWRGPNRHIPQSIMTVKSSMRIVGFVTDLPLGQAINRVHAYQVVYNETYPMVVEFSLIAVSQIETLSQEAIDHAGLEVVEQMPQNHDQLQNRQ